MKMYDEELPDEQIVKRVMDHAAAIRANPHHRFHAQMALMPEQSGRALDFGCGWGVGSIGMWERGHDVLGIDYSGNEVDICRLVWGERERLEFASLSIEELGAQRFELVLSSQVAEHVHNLGTYLCGINRICQ